ncbi:MAG: DUF6951 family protein [Methanomassiliicoccales archaeon]
MTEEDEDAHPLLIETEGEVGQPVARTYVCIGVCRFNCEIKAYNVDGKVRCIIKSDCSCVQRLGEALEDIDPCSALKMPYSENYIFQKSGEYLAHSTCPVPIAILKTIEVASGLALPRDVEINIESC